MFSVSPDRVEQPFPLEGRATQFDPIRENSGPQGCKYAPNSHFYDPLLVEGRFCGWAPFGKQRAVLALIDGQSDGQVRPGR